MGLVRLLRRMGMRLIRILLSVRMWIVQRDCRITMRSMHPHGHGEGKKPHIDQEKDRNQTTIRRKGPAPPGRTKLVLADCINHVQRPQRPQRKQDVLERLDNRSRLQRH